MKVCPVCQTQYDDDSLETCANEGATLVAPPAVESNPSLPPVVPALADAATSDFDIEAVQREIARQDAPSAPAPGAEATPEAAAEPTPMVSSEPTSSEAVETAPDSTGPAPLEPQPEPQPTPRPKAPRKKLSPIFLLSLLAVLIGLGVGAYFWFSSSDKISIELRSTPAGATVLIDGKEAGKSPLNAKVTAGIHEVIFEQSGYESIQETILVTKDGHVVVREMKPIQRSK